jgi:hypothetical protein
VEAPIFWTESHWPIDVFGFQTPRNLTILDSEALSQQLALDEWVLCVPCGWNVDFHPSAHPNLKLFLLALRGTKDRHDTMEVLVTLPLS